MTIAELITSISTRFIQVTSDAMDAEIHDALARVGRYVGVDRMHVLLIAPDRDDVLDVAHEWCHEGVQPLITGVPQVSTDALGPWMETLWGLEPARVEQVAAVPADQRLALGEIGLNDVCSVILLPLAHGTSLLGCLSVQRTRQRPPISAEHVSLLESLGVILVNGLHQLEVEEEKQQLADQLRQSQKMEAIGTLAGGVAHDMNNVLGAIMGAASLLKQDLPADGPNAEEVSLILDACRRGRRLTRNLLGFARKGRYRREKVYLAQLVAEMLEILGRTVDKRVRIVPRVDEDLPPVAGDPNQLYHALMNVCLNGVDAMSEGGELTLDLERVLHAGDGEGPDRWRAFVQVRVSDTGHGMDEQTLAHAFEPFYTTKPQGVGTGLGLSMVYGTVENHGGTVQLESAPGEGTTVAILLPALVSEEVDGPEETVETEAFHSVGEGVLLVDDEDLIRRVGERLLRRLGYRVMVAEDGEEAIALLEEHGSEISVVILDLVMPGLDGEATFHRLRELDPLVPIVLSSGYSRDDNVKRLLMAGANGFLPKPFELKHLARALKQVGEYSIDEESGPV